MGDAGLATTERGPRRVLLRPDGGAAPVLLLAVSSSCTLCLRAPAAAATTAFGWRG